MNNSLRTPEEMAEIYRQNIASDTSAAKIFADMRELELALSTTNAERMSDALVAEQYNSKPQVAARVYQQFTDSERQQRRKEVAYMGIRQYKKLNRALRAHAISMREDARCDALGKQYSYVTYPVQGSTPEPLPPEMARQLINQGAN